MKLLTLAVAILFCAAVPSAEGQLCSNVYFYAVGNSLTDYRNLTMATGFTSISNTVYFQSSRKTVFYAGGWLLNYSTFDAESVLGAYVGSKRSEYNLIFIDWSFYTMNILFNPMINQTSCVASYAKSMIDLMTTQLSLTPDNIHLIGFSYGAHLMGYLGRLFTTTLPARITGLDPGAALGYTDIIFRENSFEPLKSTDATFVDVIHTSAGKFGYQPASGHVDFYVNGGSTQNGCTLIQSLLAFKAKQTIKDAYLLVCSHARAVYFYSESVKRASTAARPFQSVRCTLDATEFTSVNCTDSSDSMSMGFYATNPVDKVDFSRSFLVATTASATQYSLT